MNYKTFKSILDNELGRILMLNKSRGIEDFNVLKILLKHYLNVYGFELALPYNDFSDVISIDTNKSYYKIEDKIKLIKRIEEIIKLLSEELNKIGIIGTLKFSQISPKIINTGIKYTKFKFSVFIENIENQYNKNVSFILQNKKNGSYYLKSNNNNAWIGVYSEAESKIFSDVDELAEVIITNDLKNIKLIKHDSIKIKAKNIVAHYNKVKNKNAEFIIPHTDYNLYNWQIEAYKSWEKNNFIGVIEAVTGSGKTQIAKYAIHLHLVNGYDICVLVPTIDLQEQWYKVLLDFKSYGIYKLGGNNKNQSISKFKIIIAVIHTAVKSPYKPENNKGLLIADECHHYGSPSFQKALFPYFSRRLGLTATYQRFDEGVEKYLNTYFNEVCYSLTYKQALAENVIAHFKVAFIGVNMSKNEEETYTEYENYFQEAKSYLLSNGIKYKSFGEFMREVQKLAKGDSADLMTVNARKYIKYWNAKRKLLSDISAKYNILENKNILDIIKKSSGTLIFSQFIDAAKSAVQILKKNNIIASVVEGEMDKIDRNNVLAEFESGKTEVIVAPLLLDEGVNVPSSDLAIIIANHSMKRQMIQRIGRVLRKKADNRIAKIIRIYTIGTSEDLTMGAHEDFIEEILNVADNICYVEQNNVHELIEFFNL
jgi:RNA polymerase primary sigma factor